MVLIDMANPNQYGENAVTGQCEVTSQETTSFEEFALTLLAVGRLLDSGMWPASESSSTVPEHSEPQNEFSPPSSRAENEVGPVQQSGGRKDQERGSRSC